MKETVGLYALLFLMLTVPAACYEYIPPNIGEVTKDYYNVTGEPNLSIASVWESEFDSGESSSLFIRIINKENLSALEIDELPLDSDESRDADLELKLESDATTAVNIRGLLENTQGAPLRITGGVQEAGYLRNGEVSQPMEFKIETFNNSTSGSYELSLNLTYQHLMEAQVAGSPEPEFNYWYVEKQQELPIYIKIRPEADFRVESVRANTISDQEYMLYITYRNTGSEVADNAVARIIEEDPFTFEDDTAFLGTLSQGESSESKFLIEMDEEALLKTYGIKTEVEYRDRHGERKTSELMIAPFRLEEILKQKEKNEFEIIAYLTAITGIIIVANYYMYKK